MATAKKIRLTMDANGNPVQHAFHPVATDTLTIGAAADVTVASWLENVEVVQLYSDALCYVRFSSSASDVATNVDFIFPAGIIKEYALHNMTYVSCLRVGVSAGTLYVTKVD